MGHRLRFVWELFRDAFREFRKDKAPRLGAALAYYTLFSLAPLMLIAIAIAGAVFGADAARGEIVAQAQSLVGPKGAEALQAAVNNAAQPGSGIVATILGAIVLLFGASGVFSELQGALDTIWEVPPRPGRGIFRMFKDRFLSFALVLCVGFLLLVSLVLSAALSAAVDFVAERWAALMVVAQFANLLLSLAMATVLFALIYKVLPGTRIAWRDVWLGAFVTSVLFSIGKYLIGLYLGRSSTASVYGAAGSVVVLLVWTYYAAQILLFGAEITEVVARRRGHVRPGDVVGARERPPGAEPLPA